MKLLGTMQLFLLAGVGFALLAGLVVSALVPAVLRWTAAWTPAARHRALLLTSVAPMVLALASVLAVALPSLLALAWPAPDHCLVEHDHPHLCLVHLSASAGGWSAGLLLAVLGWLAMRLTSLARALARGAALVRQLSPSSRRVADREAWVVPGREPVCLSVGVLRPKTVVSQGLLAEASPADLTVMMEHEHAHQRRHDTLLRVIARFTSTTMLPDSRRSLLAALELSSERACDEESALRVGDRLQVAETLVAMERRLSAPRENVFVVAFGPSGVPERVEALLAPPRQSGAYAMMLAGFVVVIFVVLASFEPLHHATETALGLLIH